MNCGFENLNSLCVEEMLSADLSWLEIFLFPLPLNLNLLAICDTETVFRLTREQGFIMKGGVLHCS